MISLKRQCSGTALHLFNGCNLPQAMLETVVGGRGINKVTSSQLFDVSKSLHMSGVHDGDDQWVKNHVTVNQIVEDLNFHF